MTWISSCILCDVLRLHYFNSIHCLRIDMIERMRFWSLVFFFCNKQFFFYSENAISSKACVGLNSLFAPSLNQKLCLFRKLHFFLRKPNTIEQTRKIISAFANDIQIYSFLNPRIYEILWMIVNIPHNP